MTQLNYSIDDLKPIPGFEGYGVTRDGRVWAYPGRGFKNIRKGRWISTIRMGTDYLSVNLRLNGKTRPYYLHRLIALAYIPNPSNLPFVNHKDCNKLNNDIPNLEWVTRTENLRHARRNGCYPKVFNKTL